MIPAALAAKFPRLVKDGATKTSEASGNYNCIAWSAKRDKKRWWQPNIEEKWDYWPDDVPNDESFESFIAIFERLGYVECDSEEFELGYEKVVLYSSEGFFTHVASQLPSGAWTSKLGPDEDIRHNTIHALEGLGGWEYGRVKTKLKRPYIGIGRLRQIVSRVLFLLNPLRKRSIYEQKQNDDRPSAGTSERF